MNYNVDPTVANRVLSTLLECCEGDGECVLELRSTGTRYLAMLRHPDAPNAHTIGRGQLPLDALADLARELAGD